MADLTGPNPDEIQGTTAADAAITSQPVTVGARASTALPTAMSTDGDVVNLWASLNGSLNVIVRDVAGAATEPVPHYTEDEAMGAVGNAQGSIVMGRASAAVPASVSADGDAVSAWLLRNGVQNVRLVSSGGVAIDWTPGPVYTEDTAVGASASVVGYPMLGRGSAAIPTSVSGDNDLATAWLARFGALNVILRDTSGNYASASGSTQYVEDVAFGGNGTGTLMMARRDDALSTLTPVADDAVGLRVGDKGALWVQISDGAGAQITSFGGGTQYVEDVALGATPTGTLSMGVGSTALPTAMTADGDAVGLWASTSGALNVILRDTAGAAVAAGTQYAADSAVGVTATGTVSIARASTAVPSAMSADGDGVALWASRKGSLINAMAPHVGLVADPWTLTSKTAQYTGTQTSAVLQAGAAGETIVVTKVQIQTGGTVAGTMQLYFGTGAYSRGTSKAIFDGEFAPSNSLKPGVVMDGPFIAGATGDDVLVTTSAAINPLTVTIWYYIVT
jgi:hypothetical protein